MMLQPNSTGRQGLKPRLSSRHDVAAEPATHKTHL